MVASSSGMQSSKGIACQTFYEKSIVASRKKWINTKLWLFIIYRQVIVISHLLTDLDMHQRHSFSLLCNIK